MRLSEYLEQIGDVLRQGWCKGALAKTRDGFTCSVFSPKAVEWCAIGAILKVTDNTNTGLVVWIREWVAERLPLEFTQLSAWNDFYGTTKEEVLRVISQSAAEALLAEGGQPEDSDFLISQKEPVAVR